MPFLQCMSSVTDWPAWKHTDGMQSSTPAQPVCARTSLLHALDLHSTPLTQRLNVHKSSACIGRVMMRMCCRLLFPFLVLKKAATERVSSIFLPLALRRGFTSYEELWCLYRLRVKSSSAPARLMAVRSKQERKTGDTGHCNEHLGHICHQSMGGSEIENS